MLLLALTGSLATGKSTVSSVLSQPPYNIPIIDADLLARKVVEPGTAGYNQILKHFGPTTPDLLLPVEGQERKDKHDDGKGRPINRAALGRRVFGSSPERQRDRKILNGIIHPAVRRSMAFAIFSHFLRGSWAVVLDVPLLYDSRLDIFSPVILMVAASPSIQMQRLRLRDAHLSEEEASDRVASQGGVVEKVERTEARGRGRGYVIWNDGSKAELRQKLDGLMKEVERGRKGAWRLIFLLLWPLAMLWAGWEIARGWFGRRRWEREKALEAGDKSDKKKVK